MTLKNRAGYFLSLNFIFDKLTQTIRNAAQSTVEFDKNFTQIGLVLNQTSGQVWKKFCWL